jgi:hypothetical protein
VRLILSKSCSPIFPALVFPVNANMELPTHQPQPLIDDGTDEELSDEQIRELLNEAAVRMRAKAAGQPVVRADAPFKLPKLKPGHIADTHEKTDGNITRLDHSKLVDKAQQAMANGIKKIDDPLAIKKQKQEVRLFYIGSLRRANSKAPAGFRFMPLMIVIPIFLLSRLGRRLGCPPAPLRAHMIIVTLRHIITSLVISNPSDSC